MNHLMSRDLTLNEFNIVMPLVKICTEKEIEMIQFFESIEDDGKIFEDVNRFKYYTPVIHDNIKRFSKDKYLIQKINCIEPFLVGCLQGQIEKNFSKIEEFGPDKIGYEGDKLQPVKNMIVNNRPTQLDYMLDSVQSSNTKIKKIQFIEYNLADINYKINRMYNQKLNDLIFFRK